MEGKKNIWWKHQLTCQIENYISNKLSKFSLPPKEELNEETKTYMEMITTKLHIVSD